MNNKYLYSVLLSLFLISCGPTEVPVDQLSDKDSLKVLKESGELFTGIAIQFQSDGKTPVEKKEYKEGKLDGRIQAWYENGQIKEDYYGRHVERDVVEKSWFNNRIKKVFLEPYGEQRKWYKNGQIMSMGQYSPYGTQKIGTWQYWYEDGKLASKSHFSNDDGVSETDDAKYKRAISRPTGEWENWYDNGQLREVKSYDKSGNLNGITRKYCKNGTLGSEEDYQAGIPVGMHKLWACDGQGLGQKSFVDGKKHGHFLEYSERINTGNDNRFQVSNRYFDTKSEYFKDSTHYYKREEGQYENDKKIGVWTIWSEEGKVIQVTDYDKNNFINPEYQEVFLRKGSFGSYARSQRGDFDSRYYDFINTNPDILAVKMYLERGLVDPAKKINTSSNVSPDYGVSHWSYPIITAPEALFELIKALPDFPW